MAGVLLGFVGDVFIDREHPDEVFKEIQEELHALDLLFGNLEGTFSADPQFEPTAMLPMFAHPRAAAAVGSAGFSVLSVANNHSLDCGLSGLMETRQSLKEHGVDTCGAGANFSEARQPAIVIAGDCRVAVLASASVFRPGTDAGTATPGLAPVRAEPDENYQKDISALQDAISAAKQEADIVVASFHWGDLSQPAVVTEHERQVARAAIDAGADIVAGHHQHDLRGVEFYNGKPIFYGLGHLVFDCLCIERAQDTDPRIREMARVVDDDDETTYPIALRSGWRYLPFHPNMRISMVAWVKIDEDGCVESVGFLPCRLQPDGRVVPYDPNSTEGSEVVEFLRSVCAHESLPVTIEPNGGIKLGRFPTARIRPAL